MAYHEKQRKQGVQYLIPTSLFATSDSLALGCIKSINIVNAKGTPGVVFVSADIHIIIMCRFWLLLDPYCAPGEPHTPPIISSFSRGCGEKVFIDGTLVHCGHWSNISAQDLQPSFFTNILRNNTKV